MTDLKTKYMGLELKNPIIVASSKLTGSIDKIKEFEDSNAGAVVLKSIFEEQIMSEVGDMMESSQSSYHPEALDYINRIGSYHNREEYLKLIKDSKSAVNIPIIASLNCSTKENWTDYAVEIEKAGADALELNIFIVPTNMKESSEDIEKKYIEIFREVKSKIKLPIALKIGPYFTNLLNFADKLEAYELNALVLFNRFYPLDINIESMEVSHGSVLSSPDEISGTLRWVTLLSGRFDFDISATTGIHDANGVIKQILAGAKAVQLASTLFKKGNEQINNIIADLEDWMGKNNFSSLDDFRGKLSQSASDNPMAFERYQYIKAFVGIE